MNQSITGSSILLIYIQYWPVHSSKLQKTNAKMSLDAHSDLPVLLWLQGVQLQPVRGEIIAITWAAQNGFLLLKRCEYVLEYPGIQQSY